MKYPLLISAVAIVTVVTVIVTHTERLPKPANTTSLITITLTTVEAREPALVPNTTGKAATDMTENKEKQDVSGKTIIVPPQRLNSQTTNTTIPDGSRLQSSGCSFIKLHHIEPTLRTI